MIDKIGQLINTLEQEINDGLISRYQTNNEIKTYINVINFMNYKNKEELEQGLRLGKTSHYLERG